MSRGPKIGVALSGGSAWGVAHVGALAALLKHNISIDCIAGSSAGSLVAAPFAFGVPITTIEEAAKKLEWKQIARFAYSRMGVRTNASLAKLMKDLLGDADIKDAKIPLAIVATDIDAGKKKVFREGNVAQAVRASSAIPGYFAPVEIDGVLYVDGGITENLPVSPLADMGAEFTIGVHLAGIAPSRPKNIGEVLTRSFEVMFAARDEGLVTKVDALIKPKVAGFQPRDLTDAEKIYDEGFRAAEAAIPAIKMILAIYKTRRSNFWQRLNDFFSGASG